MQKKENRFFRIENFHNEYKKLSAFLTKTTTKTATTTTTITKTAQTATTESA